MSANKIKNESGQSLIEALVAAGLLVACVGIILSLSFLAFTLLKVKRWSYETLICCEWAAQHHCTSQLESTLKKTLGLTQVKAIVFEARNRRDIKIQFSFHNLFLATSADSIKLPLQE